MIEQTVKVSFIELSGGRRLAYALSEGRLPGVMFLGGFKSDMTGSKAIALEAFCRARGQRFLRFDYSGHGQSSGDFRDGTIGQWKQDVIDMLDKVMPGKNILVGSSLGGWLMLLAAMARPQSVAALVGIASGPDFTERLIWEKFTPEQKQQIKEQGVFYIPDCYGEEPYPITLKLIEEARNHLILANPIPITVPIHLIHGKKDPDVPWQMAVELRERLESDDVELIFIEEGGHRLSEPDQLEVICKVVGKTLCQP